MEGKKEGRKKEFGPPNLHHRSTPLPVTTRAKFVEMSYAVT